MFPIANKQILAKDIKRLDVSAEAIARKARPGQFVMAVTEEGGEWIPLSIVEADPVRGLITLIVREVGPATRILGGLSINGEIPSLIGPLGRPLPVEKKGLVVCAASGIGAVQLLPVCRALKEAGNKVIGVIGARTRRQLVLEAQMRISCQKIFIATNDGSYERRGLASEIVKELLDKEPIKHIYTAGPADMMKSIVGMAQAKGIPAGVFVNPVMLCGNGVCGSCRVRVGRETVLACQDGPYFPGSEVDFDELKVRMSAYKGAAESPDGESEEPVSVTRLLSEIFRQT